MSNLLLIAACLVLGVVLARTTAFPAETPKVLNAFVLHVALPAMVFDRMRTVEVGSEAWLPASMAWAQLAVVGVAVAGLGRLLGWTREVRAAVLLTAGVGNTSFVGWPLVEALVGPEGLPTAILADQLGSFPVVALAGTAIAAWGAGGTPTVGAALARLARFPALPALIVALSLRHVAVPEPVGELAARLGATLTPLALVSVGFQLRPGSPGEGSALAAGLALKLAVAPAVLLAAYTALGVPPGLPLRVTVLEAAMPPMITGAILAIEANLAPALAGRMIGLGIPLGVLTVAAWSLVLPS